LLERLQARERAACEAFVDAHYAGVYRFCCWLTNDAEISADLTQESFAGFWASLSRLKVERAPDLKAWLYGIARNQWRKRCRAARVAGEWDRSPLDQALDVQDAAPGPEEIALAAGDALAVAQAVADLPPDYREALVLRVFQELSYAQVAETLGIGEGLARWRVHQARSGLRKALTTARVRVKAGV
jgi:RNA polymerase sigma-70 factor (ECF subfamily)